MEAAPVESTTTHVHAATHVSATETTVTTSTTMTAASHYRRSRKCRGNNNCRQNIQHTHFSSLLFQLKSKMRMARNRSEHFEIIEFCQLAYTGTIIVRAIVSCELSTSAPFYLLSSAD
jgi:hypothetical protein